MLFFTLLFTFCCDLSIREENSKSATRVKAPHRGGAYENIAYMARSTSFPESLLQLGQALHQEMDNSVFQAHVEFL